MKNLLYLIVFSALITSFNACKDTEDLDAWREANFAAYDAITKDSRYKELKTPTGPTGVYYRVIQSGTGTEHPLQTSEVDVYYKGTYYDGSTLDAGTAGNSTPATFPLYGESVIRGFSFALQNMVVGDKWEIWIPYYLAYGSVGLQEYSYYYYQYVSKIKGYSTLVFEIELVSINQYPE